MANFIPEIIADEEWQPLVQQRDYAVHCDPSEILYFRFGQRHGMYVSVDPTDGGRVLNALDYATGDISLLGKLPVDTKTIVGRTSDCVIKVMHAIMSRQHVELTLRGNVLIVRDLGSTNGTFLFKQIKHFDINEYSENHPLEKAAESTTDWVHEAFGPTIDDFLKTYSQSKGN